MTNLIKAKENPTEERKKKKPSVADGTTPAKLRVQRDINELQLPTDCKIRFPNGVDDLMKLEVTICPDEGYYRNGKFVFSMEIPSCYPYEAPKVKCKTGVFHPNIDYEGNVSLNILREDWMPVLDINIVIYGLYNLFLEPIWENSLNDEAALLLVLEPRRFKILVQESIPMEDSSILDMASLVICD